MARAISSRIVVRGRLLAESPLHVGGLGARPGVDLVLAEDGQGRPYVPGTGLAGALRSWLAGRLGGLEKTDFLWGFQQEKKDAGHASFVLVDDGLVAGSRLRQEVRDGVGIDRSTGSAARSIKYTRAVLPRGSTIAFSLVVELQPGKESAARALLGRLLRALQLGEVQLGAAQTRGLGRVRLEGQRGGEPEVLEQRLSPDPVEHFPGNGLPLAILGEPKPAQARFYVAASPQGEAQPPGITKVRAGYELTASGGSKGLRGRKVYPHHRSLPEGYWQDPMQDRTQSPEQQAGCPVASFQEYRRPHEPETVEVPQEHGPPKIEARMREDGTFELKQGEWHEQRDDQNRSVRGWVRPGQAFSFEIELLNLSDVELGGLVWLLTLPEGHFHRLGGGKPLGFGSVRLELQEIDVRDGRSLAERYRQAFAGEQATRTEDPGRRIATLADAEQLLARPYRLAVARAYGSTTFEEVPFVAALLRASSGFDDGLPVHYPRARQADPLMGRPQQHVPPHPDGLAYEWFVANEATEHGEVRHGLPLPDLVDDGGLPLLDER